VRSGRMIAAVTALLLAPLTTPVAAAAAPPVPVFADGEAQPVFDPADVVRQDLFVRTPVDSDGDGQPDETHVQVTRPQVTEQGLRVPVVYQVSPYYAGGNDVANHDVDVELSAPGPDTGPISSRYDDYFLARGFAMVYAESLGSGQSTGCPTTGGRNETAGAKAVVDWLGGRASAHDAAGNPVVATWATGEVGMIGTSYNGTLPNAVATTGVAGLDASRRSRRSPAGTTTTGTPARSLPQADSRARTPTCSPSTSTPVRTGRSAGR